MYLLKISVYKWTQAVQSRVVQGSTNFVSVSYQEFLKPFKRQICMNGHSAAATMHFPSRENEDQLFIREESADLRALISCLREEVF